ncbi:MAG: FlgO family outer membrane protein [Elusimicrobiota bacterium]
MKIKVTLPLLVVSVLTVAALCPAGILARQDPYDVLVKELADTTVFTKQPKVAIMPFNYLDKRKSDGGIIISERLTTRVVKLKKFQVIERQLLEKVIQELHLESTGVIDVETTKQLGKVLGVEAIITGTLMDIQDNKVEINARLIKTDTAEVLTTSAVEVEKVWRDAFVPVQGQPQAPYQPSREQEQYRQQYRPVTAPPPSRAYTPAFDGFFDIFFGQSSGRMSLVFKNNTYQIDEVDLSLDFNGSGTLQSDVYYKKIAFPEMETESSMPFGIRFGMFGKNLGFDFEMSYVSWYLKKQKTTVTYNDLYKYNFSFFNDNYIKASMFNMSLDLLLRFSDKTIQPYVGLGVGIAFNNVRSDYIYYYYNKVYKKGLNETALGFVFKMPVGIRLQIDKTSSIFFEYRSCSNTFTFDRGIKYEVDTINMNMSQYLMGLGVHFGA